MRRVIAALVVLALAVAVFLLWPREEQPGDDTLAAPSTSTTTTTPSTTTSSSVATSTTFDDTRVVETVEEAEAILRELWFGWFEGIYLQDEDRIREVVVLEETVEQARESFETQFARAPTPDDIRFEDTEILFSDDQCLVVWTVLVLSGFREGRSGGVEVIRWSDGAWKSLSTWQQKDDLWEADCESELP